MTHTSSSQQEAPTNDESTLPGPVASVHAISETASDNDTSEKPIRDKLKKTSIASLSQQASNSQGEIIALGDKPTDTITSQQTDSMEREMSPEDQGSARGRPVKKRSFDDLEATEDDIENVHISETQDYDNGHARKRSRDVRAGGALHENRQPHAAGVTLEEEGESSAGPSGSPERVDVDVVESKTAMNPPEHPTPQANASNKSDPNDDDANGIEDEEAFSCMDTNVDPKGYAIHNSVTSPRKKRSREYFDNDMDREQKIPATEEARAQRRSDEIDRDETMEPQAESVIRPAHAFVAGSGADTPGVEFGEKQAVVTPPRVRQHAVDFYIT